MSPTVAGKLAKVVQQAEEEARGSYRDRARREYEERRAEGRLVAATRTCVTLDEKAEKEVGVIHTFFSGTNGLLKRLYYSSMSCGSTPKTLRLSLLTCLKPLRLILEA